MEETFDNNNEFLTNVTFYFGRMDTSDNNSYILHNELIIRANFID